MSFGSPNFKIPENVSANALKLLFKKNQNVRSAIAKLRVSTIADGTNQTNFRFFETLLRP
jgi:hypothetical protein